MENCQLSAGTCLDHGKYNIAYVLGNGGFGITYCGFDVKLQRKVAIKEFFPKGYCYRNPGDPAIYMAFSTRKRDTPADMGISATDEQENASSGTLEDENTDDVDCDAYAQEFMELCIGEQAQAGRTLTEDTALMQASGEMARQGADLRYSGAGELNTKLSEIGNAVLERCHLENTGWVIYTFAGMADVETVKRAVDTYISELNANENGILNLDNCAYLGVCVAQAEDGTFFWAVLYR